MEIFPPIQQYEHTHASMEQNTKQGVLLKTLLTPILLVVFIIYIRFTYPNYPLIWILILSLIVLFSTIFPILAYLVQTPKFKNKFKSKFFENLLILHIFGRIDVLVDVFIITVFIHFFNNEALRMISVLFYMVIVLGVALNINQREAIYSAFLSSFSMPILFYLESNNIIAQSSPITIISKIIFYFVAPVMYFLVAIGAGYLSDALKKKSFYLNELNKKVKTLYQKTKASSDIIIDKMADGLMVLDKNGKILRANRLMTNLLGDIEEKSIEKIKKDQNLNFPPINQLSKTKNLIFDIVLENPYRILETIASPLEIDNKNKGVILLFRDITKERKLEEARQEFLTIASHQLRTPLSMIKGCTNLLSKEATPNQKKLISQINLQGKRMVDLTNQILMVPQVEKELSLNLRLYELEKILSETLNDFKDEIKDKNITINFHNEALPKIHIDVEKIKIVLSNLLNNALIYSPKGGLINIKLIKKDKNIICSIEDFGIGINKKTSSNIFQKFFRAPNAVNMVPNGSGLGLYISKQIIDKHKGKIWFETQEGKGTTFFFTLPI